MFPSLVMIEPVIPADESPAVCTVGTAAHTLARDF